MRPRSAVLACLLLASAAPSSAKVQCQQPEPVCAAIGGVFRIEGAVPYGSAVRIGPGLLVTNRHLVENRVEIKVHGGDGIVTGTVVPTTYGGDLVLVRAKLPDGPSLAPTSAPIPPNTALHTVGYDLGRRRVVAYSAGSVLAAPLQQLAFSRLHHTAHTQPGNSGGAVVDGNGRLVGIAASGGGGVFEAIPAKAIMALKAESGADRTEQSLSIGAAYAACNAALEDARRWSPSNIGDGDVKALSTPCTATSNRQLMDLAAQALGRVRQFPAAIELFNRSLARDPNAINTRLSLAITQVFARQPRDASPHLRQLLTVVPGNVSVQRMSVQVGKQTGDKALIATALDAIKRHNPAGLEAAQRFLDAPARSQP